MNRGFAVIALVGLCAISACTKDAKPLVDAAEKYEKDTCACKDVACTAKTAKDYAAAVDKLKDEKLVASEDQTKKITEATENVVKCITDITTKAAAGAVGDAMKNVSDKK